MGIYRDWWVCGDQKSTRFREIAIVYAASVLPFLSTLLRDYSIITMRTPDIANLFFINFNIANFIAMIPGEYIWTKYNLSHAERAHLNFFEFFLLGATTLAISAMLFKPFMANHGIWVFIPLTSMVLAYPVGVLNGLKQYFLAKMVQATAGFGMALLIFVFSINLSNIYFVSLVITVIIFLVPIFAKRMLIISGGNLNFNGLINALLVTTIPYACFYITHSIVLSANESNSKTVIIGNRISVYLFTFFLIANPVFINMFKHLSEKSVNIGIYVKHRIYIAIVSLVLLGFALFLMIKNITYGLIFFSFFISVSCAITFYACKLLVLTKSLIKKKQSIITVSIILLLIGLLFLFDNKMFRLASFGLSNIAINFAALTYLGNLYHPGETLNHGN